MHQRLGRLGKSARMYYFTYGPSCADGAGRFVFKMMILYSKSDEFCIENDESCIKNGRNPQNPYVAAGGWASHGSELAFVFGCGFSRRILICCQES